MLATAHHLLGSTATYKATHKNHPCSIWVRSSSQHYYWLVCHAIEIGAEYNRRYGKSHKCMDYLMGELNQCPPNLHDNGFVDPPQCMPDNFKLPDTENAYIKYYVLDKLFSKGLTYKNGMPLEFRQKFSIT
jgi:hypothetical protein